MINKVVELVNQSNASYSKLYRDKAKKEQYYLAFLFKMNHSHHECRREHKYSIMDGQWPILSFCSVRYGFKAHSIQQSTPHYSYCCSLKSCFRKLRTEDFSVSKEASHLLSNTHL